MNKKFDIEQFKTDYMELMKEIGKASDTILYHELSNYQDIFYQLKLILQHKTSYIDNYDELHETALNEMNVPF